MVKERPVIFSAPMVRALLAGRKTQTRRAVKPAPHLGIHAFWPLGAVWKPAWGSGASLEETLQHNACRKCPYGVVGDRLWVREAALPDFPKEFSYYEWTWAEVPAGYRLPRHVLYRASWDGPALKWKSPIHMPRWASRLTLEITGVRVERLHNISAADVRAEGLEADEVLPGDGPEGRATVNVLYPVISHWDPQRAYQELWDLLNAGRGHAWRANPWVWVVEFRRLEKSTGDWL